MKTTHLILALVLCLGCVTAQKLYVPRVSRARLITLTMWDKILGTLADIIGIVNFGDNMSFKTDGNSLTLLRVNYGNQYPSWSQNFVIKSDDQICTDTAGEGLASIYSYFLVNGTYQGSETINGIYSDKWYAELTLGYAVYRYTLWVAHQTYNGVSMPVRHIAVAPFQGTYNPKTIITIDFPTLCSVEKVPTSIFNLPTYCPVLSPPVGALPPHWIWRPPAK